MMYWCRSISCLMGKQTAGEAVCRGDAQETSEPSPQLSSRLKTSLKINSIKTVCLLKKKKKKKKNTLKCYCGWTWWTEAIFLLHLWWLMSFRGQGVSLCDPVAFQTLTISHSCPSSCPLYWWRHPTISSSVALSSFCPQCLCYKVTIRFILKGQAHDHRKAP